MTVLDLSRVLASTVDATTKGFPFGHRPLRLGDVGKQGWNVLAQDLPLPLLVLKRDALANNLDAMRRYTGKHGLLHAPHGKTTMAPQLFEQQLQGGAWGITAATTQQAQVMRAFGVSRIVLANEVVAPPDLRYLVDELARDADFEVLTWVDSPESVRAIHEAVRDAGLERPFDVLLELGFPGGRTGARGAAAVDATVEALLATDGRVRLLGVAGFEGLIGISRVAGSAAGGVSGGDVGEFLAILTGTAQRLAGVLPPDYLLSAGGSTSFDRVAEAFSAVPVPARRMIRSGCYVTHDHGMNATLSPLDRANVAEADADLVLEPALEVWAHVNSVPEPGLALVMCGRRDAPYDSGNPVPLARVPVGTKEILPLEGAEVAGLNDQHLYLRTSTDLQVGDRVVFGISHPCTAFDKWQVIPVVDAAYDVVDAVRTYF